MNEYPRDEFDDVSERTRREGTHRSFMSVRDPRRLLWPLLICGVLALVVGLVMFTVVRPWAATQAPAASQSPAASDSVAPTGTAAASGTPAASPDAASEDAGAPASQTSAYTEPAASESASETPATSESTTAGGGADLSVSVGVYNGTKAGGLASAAASSLRAQGFTSVTTSNWTKAASTSTVYYKDAADEATARAVASELGISQVYRTSNIPRAVSVVVGADRL